MRTAQKGHCIREPFTSFSKATSTRLTQLSSSLGQRWTFGGTVHQVSPPPVPSEVVKAAETTGPVFWKITRQSLQLCNWEASFSHFNQISPRAFNYTRSRCQLSLSDEQEPPRLVELSAGQGQCEARQGSPHLHCLLWKEPRLSPPSGPGSDVLQSHGWVLLSERIKCQKTTQLE